MTRDPIRPHHPLRSLRASLSPPAHLVRPDATLDEIADALARDTRSRTVSVAAPDGPLQGVVSARRLRSIAHARSGMGFPGLAGLAQRARHVGVARAEDAMRGLRAPTLDTPVGEALLEMDIRRLDDLPVVDGCGRVVLELTHGAHARLVEELTRGRGPGAGRSTP